MVRCFDHATGAEVTARYAGAGWTTAALSAGAEVRVRVVVTPPASAAAGASLNTTLTATATHDATRIDVARAVTVVQ